MSQLLRKQLEFGCHNNGQITKIKQKKFKKTNQQTCLGQKPSNQNLLYVVMHKIKQNANKTIGIKNNKTNGNIQLHG